MNFIRHFLVCFGLTELLGLIIGLSHCDALVFPLPSRGNDIVGSLTHVTLSRDYNVGDIARMHNIGYLEIVEANPHLNFDRPYVGMDILLPSQFILPKTPRHGIVINLSDMRLYYYPPNEGVVYTYPIGIGREGDETPTMQTSIVEKEVHPTWTPPPEIRQKELMKGDVLPDFIPPGPDNPLGDYAMRLAQRTYLIHGTNDPYGVGMRISGGCIRLYPEDIEQLFHMVPVGTEVTIIDEPLKLGWQYGRLYAEAHVPMRLTHERSITSIKPRLHMMIPEIHDFAVEIDWNRALIVETEQRGIPELIGHAIY